MTKFKISSKAQGLSLNTIVIAAIVLIVLLLLVGLLTGYFGSWKPKFKAVTETSCSGSGGEVVSGECSSRSKEAGGFYEDVPDGKKCCWKICSDQGGSCQASCDSSKRLPTGDWGCEGLGSKLCCKG